MLLLVAIPVCLSLSLSLSLSLVLSCVRAFMRACVLALCKPESTQFSWRTLDSSPGHKVHCNTRERFCSICEAMALLLYVGDVCCAPNPISIETYDSHTTEIASSNSLLRWSDLPPDLLTMLV